MAEDLDKYNPTVDPTHTVRDFSPEEIRSTTALRKCGDAFKAWTKSPSTETAATLTKARLKFRELCHG